MNETPERLYPGEPIVSNGGRGIPDEVSLVAFATMLLRRWRILVGVPVLAAVLAVGYSIVRSRDHIARARFVPEVQSGDLSSLQGLAAQFGVKLKSPGEGESLEFYVELLRSDELLREVVTTRYRFARGEAGDTVETDLLDYYDVEGDDEGERIHAAMDALRDRLRIDTDPKATLVALRYRARDRDLAVAVVGRILDLVGEFNLRKRQSRARAEREFVESRLAEAREELRRAEAELAAFLEQNRRIGDSPELTLARGRLQRKVELQQQVYVSLAQAFEQARIEEVRNTPVITIVDRPEATVRRGRVDLKVNALLGLVLGGAVALGLILAAEYIERHRAVRPDEYAELERVGSSVLDEVLPRALRVRIGALTARGRPERVAAGNGAPARDHARGPAGGRADDPDADERTR